ILSGWRQVWQELWACAVATASLCSLAWAQSGMTRKRIPEANRFRAVKVDQCQLDSQIIVTPSLCSAAVLAAVCLAGRMPALLLKRNYIRRDSISVERELPISYNLHIQSSRIQMLRKRTGSP